MEEILVTLVIIISFDIKIVIQVHVLYIVNIAIGEMMADVASLVEEEDRNKSEL